MNDRIVREYMPNLNNLLRQPALKYRYQKHKIRETNWSESINEKGCTPLCTECILQVERNGDRKGEVSPLQG